MGCFWSCELEPYENCHQCTRRAVVNGLCYSCAARQRQVYAPAPAPSTERAYYGWYRCSCGRRWESRSSWVGRPQGCASCHSNVYPHKQRELLASDMTDSKDPDKKHKTELCQMCQQLGRNCTSVATLHSAARQFKKY